MLRYCSEYVHKYIQVLRYSGSRLSAQDNMLLGYLIVVKSCPSIYLARATLRVYSLDRVARICDLGKNNPLNHGCLGTLSAI